MKNTAFLLWALLVIGCIPSLAQTSFTIPVLETGGQKMPDQWIDKDTHHRIVRISRLPGSSLSFYFHNNPFYGNKMVFYNSQPIDLTGVTKQETYSGSARNKQLYIIDLATLKPEQLTQQASSMNGEILDKKNGIAY